jgi:hypothetical protein
MAVFALAAAAALPGHATVGTVPPALKHYLDSRFPGWHLPSLGPAIKQCDPSAKAVVAGDFYGAGRLDHALEMVYRDHLVLLASAGTRRVHVLATTPLQAGAGELDRGLDVLPQHERIMLGPTFAHDAIASLDCSAVATVTYYHADGGAWLSEVQVTE